MGIFKRLRSLSPFRSKKKQNYSLTNYNPHSPNNYYTTSSELYNHSVNYRKKWNNDEFSYPSSYSPVNSGRYSPPPLPRPSRNNSYNSYNFDDLNDLDENKWNDPKYRHQFVFSARKKRRFGTRNLIEEAMLRARIHNMPGHSSKKYKKYKKYSYKKRPRPKKVTFNYSKNYSR